MILSEVEVCIVDLARISDSMRFLDRNWVVTVFFFGIFPIHPSYKGGKKPHGKLLGGSSLNWIPG